MIISVNVLGLKRNKMKEKKRGRERSAMITPYLLLPYMHSYTYRRTCAYIPLPNTCTKHTRILQVHVFTVSAFLMSPLLCCPVSEVLVHEG